MENFQWLKPSPFWKPAATGFAQAELFVPRLFKYTSDDFIEDFLADAAQPGTPALAARELTATGDPVKLFQPAHGVFHLVCASLCCRIPGFPDRQLRPEHQEKVSFVIRRVGDGVEYGWIDGGRGWQSLGANPLRLLTTASDGGDEARLPLLPARTACGRRLWFGYLPTASAAIYQTAAPPRESSPGEPLDPRIEDELARFVTPLKGGALIAITDSVVRRTVAVYLLLELAEFLGRHLAPLLAALPGNAGTQLPGAGHSELLHWLQGETIGRAPHRQALAQALRSVADHAALLNGEGGLASGDTTFGDAFCLEDWAPDFDLFTRRIQAALDPAALPKVELPRLAPAGNERFVVRCVYERPLCARRPLTLSAASAPFRFATFFDSDAPARPIRIALPTDISPAALRKFRKGVSFMISASMQRKIAMLTGKEKDLLKGDAPNPEAPGLAFMCSFSIQIIFIIAFFLLMIFAVVFNLIFWWLPFFRICIPIPKGLMGGEK